MGKTYYIGAISAAADTTPTVMWSYGRPVMSTNDDDVATVTVSWSYGRAIIYHDAT